MRSESAAGRPRLAVVSPFLDKRHGTERRVTEAVNALADRFEIHLYAERVEDVDLARVTWHRLPRLPGPHLFAFVWWLAANHAARWLDRRLRGLEFDAVYTPGTNCLDADACSVHIVFAEFRARVADTLRFRANPLRAWPRLLHRRLYYRLIVALERRIYTRPELPLVAISRKAAAELARYYGRRDGVRVVYHGLDLARFRPEIAAGLRARARRELGLEDEHFAVLLVGNDWKKKGLDALLEAVESIPDPRLRLLVAGDDDPAPFRARLDRLRGRVSLHPPRPDIELYYAAADAYAAPSLEDAFALPPAEAMACGVPAIVSRQAGVSEVVTHGQDGLILEDPHDAQELARLLRGLLDQPSDRARLGRAAARTAEAYTWRRNTEQMAAFFESAIEDRRSPAAVAHALA